MTDILNIGSGLDYQKDAHNVDAVEACNPDEVYDITEYPWPWEDIDTIRMFHVLEHLPDIERALREVEKTLKSGGYAVVKLPIGQDAIADPDHSWGKHKKPWTWRTPEFYCGERHWDTDIGLEVSNKTVDLWSVHPTRIEKAYHQAKWNWKLDKYGPGEWCFSLPNSCGEFTVVFEKP